MRHWASCACRSTGNEQLVLHACIHLALSLILHDTKFLPIRHLLLFYFYFFLVGKRLLCLCPLVMTCFSTLGRQCSLSVCLSPSLAFIKSIQNVFLFCGLCFPPQMFFDRFVCIIFVLVFLRAFFFVRRQ